MKKYLALVTILALGVGLLAFGVFGKDTVDVLGDVPTYGAVGIGLIALGAGWVIVNLIDDDQKSRVTDLTDKLEKEGLRKNLALAENRNYKLDSINHALREAAPPEKVKQITEQYGR